MKQRYDHRYDSKRRLASYWHQVDEALQLGAKDTLVVGCGSGTTRFMLDRQGMRVVTVDIDPALQPTVLGDVTSLPFADESFDAVLCCQVLEHLPFDRFSTALRELHRVTRNGVVLSLPDQGRVFRVDLKMPRIARRLLVPLPRLRPRVWSYDGQHHWEIGAAGYDVARIEREIEGAGFSVESAFRVFENPYHRFWRLRRR